jgi:6-phosphogluconate dehydrogenase
MTRASFGVIGLAVMGRNLALNIEERGHHVAVWNREPAVTEQLLGEHPGKRLHGARTLEELVALLARPRRILLMIKAGAPVDETLARLAPLLDPDDVVIDGGNSWFEDTRRREEALRARGLRFVGMGVSGGEEGARHGPSLMPGGAPEAYALLRDVLEAIAAKTSAGPCVTHCGGDGAGHFVKMVHNGIEYGDMQLIAEAYDLLARVGGLGAGELAQVFGDWNRGRLESFLIEITAKIFAVTDPESGRPLVELVEDRAGQKGTGMWTAKVALDLGVPVPTIAAAIDARVLSSMKAERVVAAGRLAGPVPRASRPEGLVSDIERALFAAKVCSYAQGLSLIRAGGAAHGWGPAGGAMDLAEIARIWKGGCIIRARFLDDIRAAYGRDPGLASLLLDDQLGAGVAAAQDGWRRVVALAQGAGVPVPAMSASLAYFDSYRTARLPQNLTQAQRDAFGAHTYERRDRPELGSLHTDWLA